MAHGGVAFVAQDSVAGADGWVLGRDAVGGGRDMRGGMVEGGAMAWGGG